ncbi:M56 family metallopeptidase [Desulfosporosinus meridiei]|uniref:Antirepressor regulating drug resistance protein n=1 Tax=Desulfosporosinus meridiei (strain ATCC BAA-275 / DSM 13257 / KCTC 12902 / NCIMB 13706 / S10) TaxID=768704 RepID=J7IXW2_DESMD|nr:M56 family metallopeptidase [Desulfosporosinus meridiei]AFQ43541.1 antirepressor regulating drug resistance protein [Desulfosporosinus meridiei DSM 13257]
MEQFLQDVFLAVLNMSITAGYAILFVLLARLLLRKASKIFSYCLWGVVLFRLISPVSFSFAWSFFGFMKKDTMEHIPAGIGMMAQPQVDLGVGYVSQVVTSSLPGATPMASANPLQIIIFVASLVWVLGFISLLAYSLISYGLLKRKVSQAILLRDNIWECHSIRSPFVLGFLKPMIYLPPGFSEGEKSYILKHEEIHIRRYDYLIKPLAYFVLCLHWFNPLVWLSFILMTKDMEMSCDEQVLKEMGQGIKQDYSRSLLALALSHRMMVGSPLAFGESSVKSRIKNVLNYKRPTFWGILAGAAGILILSLGLISNPENSQSAMANLTITGSSQESQKEPSPGAQTQKIAQLIEDNLQTIMSSPGQSSNPDDYIKAHDMAYESILKYGGENALLYVLAQFEAGNAEGLRGQILMRLGKELLGVRNNVSDETLSPQEWYSRLQIRREVSLPDFAYQGNDSVAQLVYQTEVQKHKGRQGGFCVVAPHIFTSYREDGKLKVFVTTFAQSYRLYDNVLSEEGGGIIPAAITYREGPAGNYTLESYEQAKDGAYFASSIREYCVMPGSGKKIEGLAEEILSHYGDYSDIIKLQRENLTEHLQRHNRSRVFLHQSHYQKPTELIPIT